VPAVILILVVLSLLGAFWIEYRSRSRYRGRACAGQLWRREFPDSPKDQIRLFLECLTSSMGFPRSLRLKFEPSDRALAIYRSLYGDKTPLSDSLECEAFLMNLSQAFAVELDGLIRRWNESVTLGDLFLYVSQHSRPERSRK
jgi:hypothetical protein